MLLVPIFVRNGSKTGFSFCAFPLLLPWLLQRLSKWNSWTHMALSASVGNQSPVKLWALCSYGQGLWSKNSNLLLHCNTQIHLYLPHIHTPSHHTDFIGLKRVTRRSHKTLLLPDVQMHAGLGRKINRGLKPPRYKVAQQLFQHKEKIGWMIQWKLHLFRA